MTAAERRKQRLTREAIGGHEPMLPEAEEVLRLMAIVSLALFIVLFSGGFPA